LSDGAGREGVISDDDALAFANYIGAGSAARLVRPCAASEPVVQNRFTGIEDLSLMIVS
jgi:hypothetical protein